MSLPAFGIGRGRAGKATLKVDLPDRAYLERAGVQQAPSKAIEYTEAEVDALAVGPFAVVPHTQEVCIKYTALYKFKKDDELMSQEIAFPSLYEGLTASMSEELRRKLRKYNPKATLPISLRVLGATVGANKSLGVEDLFAFRLLDKGDKSLGASFASSAGAIGFPLHMLRHDSSASALDKPPSLLDDHKQYWHIDLKDLIRDVEIMKLPGQNSEFVVIKRDSLSAHLCHYALSVKNHEIDDLLNNRDYFFESQPDFPEFIKLPKDMFDDVYTAYKTKLAEVDKTSYDISTLKCQLVPLGPAARGSIRSMLADGEPAHITFELKVYIPVKEDLKVRRLDVTVDANSLSEAYPDVGEGELAEEEELDEEEEMPAKPAPDYGRGPGRLGARPNPYEAL